MLVEPQAIPTNTAPKACLGKIIHNGRKESRAADEIADKAGKYEKVQPHEVPQEKIVDNFFTLISIPPVVV